jgi:site-specific DNA recombinase
MQVNELLKDIKKAAGLLRISNDKTDSTGKKVDLEATLKNHEEKVTGYFKDMKWQYDLFKEVISGGSAYEDRLELVRLLENIYEYDCIVVMELPRLSRQGEVSQKIKRKVIEQQIPIITLNPFQVYDLAGNSMDSLFYDFGAAMAEYERRIASGRVKDNKMSMARQGLNASGSVPYGYYRNAETKKLEIDQLQAPLVIQVFKWSLEGYGAAKIAKMLNDRGLKNNNGNRWITNTIKAMLKRPTYKGLLVAKSYTNKKGKRVVAEKVEVNAYPALIEPELWDKVQEGLAARAERTGNSKGKQRIREKVSLLDDLVFCAGCKRRLYIKFIDRLGYFYVRKCDVVDGVTPCENTGCKIALLETPVLKKVIEYKTEIEAEIQKYESNDFEEYTADLKQQQKELEKNLEELEIDFNVIRKLEAKYETKLEMGGKRNKREEAAIEKDKEENEKQLENVENQLEEIKKKINSTPSAGEMVKKLQEKVDIIEALENRKDLTAEDINKLLKRIIVKIHYKRMLPPEILQLSSRNEKRNSYPAEIEIEYVQ